MRRLGKRFVNNEVLEQANTAYRLYKVDLTDKKILLFAEQVVIGNMPSNKKFQFRKCCLEMLIAIVKKLQERSPLKFAIVQNSSSLSLIMIACESEVGKIQFLNLIDKLSASK